MIKIDIFRELGMVRGQYWFKNKEKWFIFREPSVLNNGLGSINQGMFFFDKIKSCIK